jgi:hypothetical protein
MRRRFAVCRGLTLAGALSLAAVADKPQRSDPARREEARRVVQGDRTPEAAAEILRIARAEAVRWGLDRSTTLEMPAAVAGNAWINLGPTSADKDFNGSVYFKVDSGRARKILVDPRNSDVVYFATAGGGVWKTFDAVSTPVTSTTGPHWVPITETVGSLSIGSIALSPANPDSLILGLGDSFDVKVPGVLHSDDGGATWQGLVTLTATYLGYQPITATSVRDIQYNPTMSSTVLMATNAGLFRSTEGGVGTNWVLKDTDVAHTPQGCWSIGWVGGQTWLATCQNLTDAHGRIWRSTDDGVSWSEVLLPGTDSTDVKRMTVATSPSDVANPSSVRVYLLAAAYSASKQKDIYISSTGGTTWTSLGCYAGSIKTPAHAADYAGDQSDLDVIHDQSNYNQMLIVDPRNHDTVLAGGNLGMIRSTDAGATWDVFAWWLPTNAYPRVPAAEYVHADWHTATIAYSGPTPYFYAGTDGGIFRSTNVLSAAYGAEVWEDRLNRDLVTHMLYSVATASEGRASASCTMPASALDIVWGGMQDNGTRFRVLPGSGGSNDPTHFDQLDGGDGFGVGVGCSGPATQTGSLLLSTVPTRVDRILNGGPPAKAMTGITITPDPNFNFFMRLATDHGDTNGQTFIVPIDDASVASKNGYIFKTTNGAASWTNITGTINRADGTPATATPLPLVNITADPKNPNHYGVVSVTRAFVSSDGGVNWYETNRVYPGREHCWTLRAAKQHRARSVGHDQQYRLGHERGDDDERQVQRNDGADRCRSRPPLPDPQREGWLDAELDRGYRLGRGRPAERAGERRQGRPGRQQHDLRRHGDRALQGQLERRRHDVELRALRQRAAARQRDGSRDLPRRQRDPRGHVRARLLGDLSEERRVAHRRLRHRRLRLQPDYRRLRPRARGGRTAHRLVVARLQCDRASGRNDEFHRQRRHERAHRQVWRPPVIRKKTEAFGALAATLALCALGCKSGGGSAPVIKSFRANPASIGLGASTTLSWDVSGTTSLAIDNGVGDVTGATSKSVKPTAQGTITYTLTATGGGSSTTAQATVAVGPPVASPQITTFTASPSNVAIGSTTTLSWTVLNTVTILSIDQNVGTVTGTSKTVTVNANTIYTLTAIGPGGQDTKSVSVITHTPSLHLEYTDPTSTTAKLRLVKNAAASTPSHLVLELKVGSSPITAFGVALNIPFASTAVGNVGFADTSASRLGGLSVPSGSPIDVGSGPATAAAKLPSSGPLANVFLVGVAKKKATTSDGDYLWPADATLFSVAFDMTGTAEAVVFLAGTATADARFRATAQKKDGTEAVSKADVAIGDLRLAL